MILLDVNILVLPIAKTLIDTGKLNRGSNRRCGSRLESQSRNWP